MPTPTQTGGIDSTGMALESNYIPPVTNSQPKPTSVVSSLGAVNTASNIKANVIQPADQRNATLANQTQTAQQQDASATPDMKFLPGSGKPNPNYIAQKSDAPTPSANPIEQAQTDAILHPGQTQLYNTRTGAQEWVNTPSGSIPAGYTTQDPKTRTDVASSVQDADGTTIDKLSDGTYRRVDINGNYTLGTQAMFDSAQRVNDLNKTLDDARKGIYSPSQQAQLDSIGADYQRLIDKQTILNENTTGGTTIAMARNGLGNQTIGQQQIDKTVKDGIDAVASLTSQRDSAISKMKLAFENDDTDALKSAYDIYNSSSQNIQKQLDKTQNELATSKAKQDASDQSFATTMSGKYDDTTDPIDPYNDDKNTVLDKLKTSPKYQSDHVVAESLSPDESKFMGQLATSGVSLSNMFPSLGIGSAAASLKIGILKSMIDGATKAGLSAQDLANSMLDKQAKAKTYAKLQTQGSQLEAQETKVNSDFDLVKSLGSKVGDATIQQGIPILQNWINTGTLASTNNPKLNNWLGAITTSMTNYARVVYGQTGSAGVAQGANTEIQNLIKKGMSVATVNDYIDNVAKPEMNNTISGFKTTKDQLISDMNSADGTVNPSSSSTSSSSSSSSKSSSPDSGWAGY